MKLDFNSWLENELNSDPPTWFDPEGNSARAVMLRYRESYYKHLKWCFKGLCRDLKYFYTEFDGKDTTIEWFVFAIVYPLIFPMLPFLRACSVQNRAIKEYQSYYQNYLSREG